MDKNRKSGEPAAEARRGSSFSWRAMLILLALALVVATIVAYLLVNPFFHQRAPQSFLKLPPQAEFLARSVSKMGIPSSIG